MPLRAVSATGDYQAFQYDASGWLELKGSYKALNLRMPCCQAGAIPKTSTLGNFFFAHSQTGDCTTAPETQEHLYCKKLIAQAAQSAGWTVTTEKAGVSPTGEKWVADVFCEKGTAKLAFEVQMSPQTHDETLRRQSRYSASGVRSAWFYGPKLEREAVFSDRATPIFSLPEVKVGTEPLVARHGASLTDFVVKMLTKQLIWASFGHTEPFYLTYLTGSCGKCKRPVKRSFGYRESNEAPLDVQPPSLATPEGINTSLGRLLETMADDELEQRGFSPLLRIHRSGAMGPRVSYANHCRHCRLMVNNVLLAKWVNAVQNAPVGGNLNEDGEMVDHPIGTELIDRNTDGSGFWALLPAVSTK